MRIRLFSILSALTLVLAACGGSSQVVATVTDGDIYSTEITSETVEVLSSANVLSKEEFAGNLSNTIVELISVARAESDFGLLFSEEDIDVRVESLKLEIEAGGSTYDAFLEQRGVTETWLQRVAHQILVAEEVEKVLLEEAGPATEEEIKAFVDGTLRTQTEGCVSHILLDTEEDALAALTRVQAGEDFAVVAAEVSTGPSGPDGGDLGCASLGNYVEEFSIGAYDAEIGVATDPVRSSFGWHVILVSERSLPEGVDVEQIESNAAEVLNSTRGQPLVNAWLLEILSDADVSVDAEYGSWVTDPSPQVLPPA